MNRAVRLGAQAEVYRAVIELLRASQGDGQGWMVRSLETGKLRKPDDYTALFLETEALIGEMERRLKSTERRASVSRKMAKRKKGTAA